MKRMWIGLFVVLLCFGIVTGCRKKASVQTDSSAQGNSSSSEETNSSGDKDCEQDQSSSNKDDSSFSDDIEWENEWGTGEEDSVMEDMNTTVEDKQEVKEDTDMDVDVEETPKNEEIIWTDPVIQP